MTAPKLGHGDLVVVADGEKALFLFNDGDEEFPFLKLEREIQQDNPSTREQGTNRPGRLSDAGTHHRSAVEDTDWHRLGKERFAKEIADRLYRMAHRGDIRQLAVIAAPMVLGEMRKEYHKEVRDKLIAEIDKDLTNHPVDAIEKHFHHRG
ncbi:Host attachment protein [Zhengella mangrovi]|uniref:Host attachment protein n=1 Tax=Zhengella mangrovi TaxID=1982044 RepID=A0A2G1QTL9_9HYPH|nr:host attachment family protein [Zhengella mangrovi]PHP68873.1 Host attachment protein [Zhengella mangrovi]